MNVISNFSQSIKEDWSKTLYVLLIGLPIAIYAEHTGMETVVFLASGLSVIPMAKIIGDSTEGIAEITGPQIGGLLNATFGNAVEAILALIALHSGLIAVVKATIIGSIISNLLLVLGAAFLFGGLKYKEQTFHEGAASVDTKNILLSAIAFMIPSIFAFVSGPDVSEASVQSYSAIVGVILILMYVARLVFAMKTHADLYAGESHEEEGESSSNWVTPTIVLLITTLVVAYASELLVGSLEPAAENLGWSTAFIGVVLLPIVGNAAEHATAVTVAMKNKIQLSIECSVGSSMQIAQFLAPLVVFVGLATGIPMDLNFNWFEVVSIFVASLAVSHVCNDGKSYWLEGASLLAVYAILASGYWFLPNSVLGL